MISPVLNSTSSMFKAAKTMAGVSGRLSKGFDKEFNLNVEKEFSQALTAEHNIGMNTKVLQAHDEMIGTIIDIYI